MLYSNPSLFANCSYLLRNCYRSSLQICEQLTNKLRSRYNADTNIGAFSQLLRMEWQIEFNFIRVFFGFFRCLPSETRTNPERIPNKTQPPSEYDPNIRR